MSSPRWIPMESNPSVMTKYMRHLGMPEDWKLTDVYGLDPELLAFLPRPVLAVILLFPHTTRSDPKEEDYQPIGQVEKNDDLFYMKQTIGNACGCIALIHATCNNMTALGFKSGILNDFYIEAKEVTPEKRGSLLENNSTFAQAHATIAPEGQTAAPDSNDRVKDHFVAFIHKEGRIYELDGRKVGPVVHGNTSPDTFIEDVAPVIKKFMNRDPTETNFSVIALVRSS